MKPDYFAIFEKDYFAKENGIKLIVCEPGHAVAEVEINKRHLNGAGIVHGGLLFTLADFAFGAASNSFGKVALTINSQISYFKKSDSGMLRADAKVIAKSNKLMHGEVNVINGDGDILASYTGTMYVTDTEIEA